MSAYEALMPEVLQRPCRWLVTGATEFIGSHLVERLLILEQDIVGLDSFAPGYLANLESARARVGEEAWHRFLVEVDLCDPVACQEAARGAHYVLHHAALGNLPRPIADPLQRIGSCE